MKMKQTLFALLSIAAASNAAPIWETQDSINAKVDSINARRGVEIGGSIRAVAQKSAFDTDQDKTGLNVMPDVERSEYAYADLDFHFRPYENIRANVMLRLGAGMQEYFASPAKTMSVGWINVEGNANYSLFGAKNSLYFVVGDFRQQYTPLTLFAPGVDVLYEPTIFARKRHMAESQELLVGNQRNLQGANLQYRMDFGGLAGELRLDEIFARLNRTAVLDFSGAEGNIFPNGNIAGASQASNMDKWLSATNIEYLPFNKNLYLGFTGMYIFDDESSYSYTYRHPDNDLSSDYEMQSINPFDVDPQKTAIFSGRIGADIAEILGNKNLTLDIVGEYAYSADDVYTHTQVPALDALGQPVVDEYGEQVYNDISSKDEETGSAILVTLNAGYKFNDIGLNLSVDFIRNDSAWFNNVAQSPKFFARRILNSDKDGNTIRYGVNSPLYSTFDALYNYTPKYSPAATTLGTDDGSLTGGQTESYNIAPFNKNSYSADVYTRSQLALIETLTDPALQLSLPNGLATSNRQGAQGIFKVNWSDFAEAQGLFSYYSHVSPLATYKEAKFTEFGGGAKVDIFKILGFKLPLEISGSYKHSERKMDTDNRIALGTPDGTAELKSDFINAGFYVQYLPRLGVTAGFQYVKSEYNDFQGALSGLKAPLMTGKQMQWMVGLDYTLAKNAWLSINYGMISVENEYNTAALVQAQSSEGAYNLPNYYEVEKDVSGKFKHEFTQSVVEASINVEF